ncbi:MAG: DUF2958 domain-containing protein [Candidatus Gracilibacteria bacterium]|nr:DUF2958 domain-containing protein [Candidatus Gracilibacteria bacterium]
MKLITKTLENRFKKIGFQGNELGPIVVAKFFNPCGSGTWYATEYDKERNICFGYVTGLGFDEWGSFSIEELESVKCPPLNLPIERDLYFSEKPISEARPELKESIERRREAREIEERKNQNRDQYRERE